VVRTSRRRGADGHGEGGQPPTPPTASASNASTICTGWPTVPGIGCGSPRPLGYTHATQLLNDGVPFHVVQRYLGHQRPEMTADTRPPPKRNSSNRPPPRCSIRHVSPAHRIWPDVPFSENDAAKAAGARTDPGRRSCSRRGIPGSRQIEAAENGM